MSTLQETQTIPEIPADDYDFLKTATDRHRFNGKFVSRMLVTLLLLVGAFWGGIAVQKSHGASAPAITNGRNGGQFQGDRAGTNSNFGGGNGRSGGATSGQVTLVDGVNIYVTGSDGNIVKVVTNPGSKVTKSVAGTAGDVKVGDQVTVRGATGADGTVNANSVSIGGGSGFGGG